MEGGFIYRDKDGIIQQHNGGGMFGLVTKNDWNEWRAKLYREITDDVIARYQNIRAELKNELAELINAQAPKPQAPEPVETNGKLWTITITRNDEPHPERYTWEDCTGYNHARYFDGAVSGIDIHFKNGATTHKTGRWNVEMTEQKAEPEVKSVKLVDTLALSYRLEGLVDEMVKLQSYADELDHRIEMLELRLNGAEKKAKPKTRN